MRFDQFKINLVEAILDEAEMTPKAFQEFLNSPLVTGMKMGFELESVIRGVRDYNEEPVDDMDYDERTYDIENILTFFSNGDNPNTDRTISELREKLYEDFMEWQDAEFDDYLRTEDAQTNLKELTREILDDRDYNERQIKLAFDAAEEGKPSDEYVDAEISAIEKIRDEWREGEGDDWDKYADAMDMNYMSEVYYKFDRFLYWPYTTYGDGDEYLNVDWVAEELYDETGISAWASDSYHGTSRARAQEKGQWIIEPDSSISADDSDEGGLEFVSPALDISEALKQMQQVLEFIRAHGYTNSSTGLHINISVPDFTTDKLDYVKLAIFLGDKHVLEQFDRLSNHYCDGAYKKIGNKIQQMKGDEIKAVMAKMKEGLTLAASKIIHTGYTNKYTSINTKEGYIEFRGPGGDYLDKKPEELTNTALRMALALRIATDPEMYKQEYQKRLYKVLTDADEKDDLTKFKDYVSRFQTADKETRSYIIQTIQAEREARKAKKKQPEGSRPYWMVRRRGDTRGGGMAVFADTAYDAVKEVAKSWGMDPIYLVATPMADEKPDDNYYSDLDNRIRGSEGATFVIDYNGTKYRQRANSADEAKDLLSARIGVERNLLWDIQEEPRGIATGGVTVDGNARGNYHLVNSNRSIDTRMTGVSREEAHSTARRMEQEYGLESGSIHVTRINDQTGSHNWRIYDVANPDLFTVVAADSRTDAADRWAIVNPERPADMVDAVPEEGAMKYEFSIAQQAFNPDSRNDNDRFIYPQEIYRMRTNFTEMPVRRVWATNKEQAISKVRSFFHNEFWDVPEEWLKINVVGI